VVVADYKYLPISFKKREWAGKILPMTLKNTAPWEYNPVAFLFIRKNIYLRRKIWNR